MHREPPSATLPARLILTLSLILQLASGDDALRTIWSKQKSCSAWRLAASALAGRVRPHSFLEQRTRRRYLVESVDGGDVGQRGRLAEQAAVNHEHL